MMPEHSEDFIEKMKNRMEMSLHKYGSIHSTKNKVFHRSLQDCATRIAKYKETGNTEWLVDAANFLMIEFMYPSHDKAHFKATDSNQSPGISKRN